MKQQHMVRRSRGSDNADYAGQAGLEKAWHVSAEPRARSFAGATSLNWSVGPTSAGHSATLATVAPASERALGFLRTSLLRTTEW